MMWSSLILGHPLAIMMYYHDYIIENYGASLVSQYGSLQVRIEQVFGSEISNFSLVLNSFSSNYSFLFQNATL